MANITGFIYVALGEKAPLHKVIVALFASSPIKPAKGEKTSGKLNPPLTELAHINTPLWFAYEGDNMRYEIRVFEDGSCEISRKW